MDLKRCMYLLTDYEDASCTFVVMGEMSAAGFANYSMRLEQDVACREIRLLQSLQHRRHRHGSDICAVLMLCGERHWEQACVLHVVDTDDTHLIGHADTAVRQASHDARSGEVVGAYDGFGSALLQHLLQKVDVIGITSAHKIL